MPRSFELVLWLAGLLPVGLVPDAVAAPPAALPKVPPPAAVPAKVTPPAAVPPKLTPPVAVPPNVAPSTLIPPAVAPPAIEPDPVPSASEVRVVEIVLPEDELESSVQARPWFAAPSVGQVARGARVAVRGELATQSARGCNSQLYYALQPFGWICADFAEPTEQPPSASGGLTVAPSSSLPYAYRMVRLEEGFVLPMWRSLHDLESNLPPERQLARGDSIAVMERVHVNGADYYLAHDGRVVPAEGTTPIGSRSDWQGVVIDAGTHLPFGWVARRKAPVFDAPGGERVDWLSRRTRVDVLEQLEVGRKRFLRVGEGRFIDAAHVSVVRAIPRPASTLGNPQWIDIDLGEQVVVAYWGERPVYATLTSSGRRPHATPRGDYPIWAKVSAISMKSQPYDDLQFYVDRVPWVLFFQAHNALHGAYWHDGFGATRSHGCANLAPKDARYLFEWLQPKLPPGWSALRFWDLEKTPVVHVRNSHMHNALVQEREIGPPDREAEAKRLEAAQERRAEPSDVVLEPSL